MILKLYEAMHKHNRLISSRARTSRPGISAFTVLKFLLPPLLQYEH